MCPSCKHELAAKDLVPVFSWLYLQGKCRYCKASISAQYPIVEIVTAALFALSYWAWPYSLGQAWQTLFFITWLALVVGLVALAVYDIKWMLLPNKIVYKLYIIAGASYAMQIVLGRSLASIVGVSFGVLVGGGIFWVLYQVSKGNWIGGGDVKLGALLGFVLGSGQLAFLNLFFASLLGILWILPGFATKKISKNSRVPFGPFLIAAAYITMLWGQDLIDWYTNTFLMLG